MKLKIVIENIEYDIAIIKYISNRRSIAITYKNSMSVVCDIVRMIHYDKINWEKSDEKQFSKYTMSYLDKLVAKVDKIKAFL